MEYRFNAEEWDRLSVADRVHRCRLMAEQARQLSEGNVSRRLKTAYMLMHLDWLRLAEEIEANQPQTKV